MNSSERTKTNIILFSSKKSFWNARRVNYENFDWRINARDCMYVERNRSNLPLTLTPSENTINAIVQIFALMAPISSNRCRSNPEYLKPSLTIFIHSLFIVFLFFSDIKTSLDATANGPTASTFENQLKLKFNSKRCRMIMLILSRAPYHCRCDTEWIIKMKRVKVFEYIDDVVDNGTRNRAYIIPANECRNRKTRKQ